MMVFSRRARHRTVPFYETSDKTDWLLTESKPVRPDGVLVLIYERNRQYRTRRPC